MTNDPPKGTKPVRRTLASGQKRVYWYHRATGERIDPDGELEPFSAAWLLEVDRLDKKAAHEAEAVQAVNDSQRTFYDLWKAYRGKDDESASEEWKSLKPRTRSDYQKVRDWLGDKSAKGIVVKKLTDDDIRALRDKAARQRGRRFANYVVTVIRIVMEWGRDRGWLGKGTKKAPNPAQGMKPIKRPKHARKVNRAWSPDEVKAFAEAAPFQLLVPFSLGLFAAMRQGDALTVTWSAMKTGQLEWIASKNGENCKAPVTGVFREILAAARAKRGKAVQIAVNSDGQPWTESGFRASFFKLIRKLVAEGKMEPGCTFHGLRSTVVSSARDTGESDFRAAAAIGDRSTDMAALYGADADRIAAQTSVLEGVQKRFGNISVENASGKRPSKPPRKKG